MEIVSSMSFIGLIVFCMAAAGVLFFLLLLFFLRGGQTMSRQTGGAVALTVATILLLSGAWCIFLSPEVTQTEWPDSFYNEVSIVGQSNWSYPIDAVEEDRIDGSVNMQIVYYDEATTRNMVSVINNTPTFNIFIYDPDGKVVWSQINVTYTYFNIKAIYTGIYEIEVFNPSLETIQCYVQFSVRRMIVVRPLESFGQWLLLVSLPVYGLGTWATGLLSKKKK
jgi:hypothetical protein